MVRARKVDRLPGSLSRRQKSRYGIVKLRRNPTPWSVTGKRAIRIPFRNPEHAEAESVAVAPGRACQLEFLDHGARRNRGVLDVDINGWQIFWNKMNSTAQ